MRIYYKEDFKILFNSSLYSYLTNDVIVITQITEKSTLELFGLGCFYALDKNDFKLLNRLGMI